VRGHAATRLIDTWLAEQAGTITTRWIAIREGETEAAVREVPIHERG